MITKHTGIAIIAHNLVSLPSGVIIDNTFDSNVPMKILDKWM